MPAPIENLTPSQIVAELDQYIVGQDAAKRAVAVALRNRYRRQQLPENERAEITPKNILMIGPTGVGKTEIARRLAQLARAPFVKVEATKFTEVGYVGRDVDSMVRDLAATAVRLVEKEMIEEARPKAKEAAMERLIDMVEPLDPTYEAAVSPFGLIGHHVTQEQEREQEQEPRETREERRARLRKEIESGKFDETFVDVEAEEQGSPFLQVFSNQGLEEMGLDFNNSPFNKTRRVYRKAKVKDALEFLEENEARAALDSHTLHQEGLKRAEQTGIVFIDEIDKVAMPAVKGAGPDVSREGVQRDLLPVIEGSTVQTKFGPIATDHILFICAGAFHESKPSDLIPELQGRLPIRVHLSSLNEEDFCRILREPRNALTKQYEKLLSVEGVKVTFEDGALDEIAHMAAEVNLRTENIGARRLHTMVERLLEELLFDAPERAPKSVNVDPGYVRRVLGPLVKDLDSSHSSL
jgi:ATP-dependent HslUV protease ATP-binding subunit HslU